MNFSLDQYAAYVWASYALFVLFLIWDYLMPRLRLQFLRKTLGRRLRREQARKNRSENPT